MRATSDPGPPSRPTPSDIVAVIPQATLEGIPQPNIVISRTRPTGWPQPSSGQMRGMTKAGDSFEGESTDGVSTTDGYVDYRRGGGVSMGRNTAKPATQGRLLHVRRYHNAM